MPCEETQSYVDNALCANGKIPSESLKRRYLVLLDNFLHYKRGRALIDCVGFKLAYDKIAV